ncbi:hypothetical protein Hypma_003983 [Hypsizygus marmoreus]|uniref:Uncharacterized protein n=1 Tax=Hypsizygus marmoreus TaxID=39966 RepID=A0A369J120_HYPMA|nr:hypothetical protein Hypma_003983 [Hypsizygus marmoreus]
MSFRPQLTTPTSSDPGKTPYAFTAGTRVFVWASNGKIRYGSIVGSSRLVDGTVMLEIMLDSGRRICLPAAGITLVQ